MIFRLGSRIYRFFASSLWVYPAVHETSSTTAHMKILLLGSGGREHALAWKLSQSALCTKLFIAPGNAGTAQCGTNVELQPTEFDAVGAFCLKEEIRMLVVGPEEPLVKGIEDFFRDTEGLGEVMVIGPSRAGALLEGSKAVAKAFMKRHGIPTAAYREFDAATYDQGVAYLQQHGLPVVLKADGLAAGKGVLICSTREEALQEFSLMIRENKFGEASKKVVVEEYLSGVELSVFVLTDGKHYVLLPEAKDYKRIGEGDTGLNTGGMGAVSPVPFASPDFMRKVEEHIVVPTVRGLETEKIRYTGIVFIGLIKVGDDPYVIEYNCRLGDPETEVVLPRLQNDLVALFQAAATGALEQASIQTDPRTACTVMAVSGGYPGTIQKGFAIKGLPAEAHGDMVFHAATRQTGDEVVTTGGRVLCVTSFGKSISAAVSRSTTVLRQIHFEGMYYRSDIGFEFG